jgi:hypothetical protein
MTLKECLTKIEEIKETWPCGINFKNKSKFIGFSFGDILLTIEQVESKEWGIELESLDKEFNDGLTKFLGQYSDKP